METKHNITDFIKVAAKPPLNENYFTAFEAELLQRIKADGANLSTKNSKNNLKKKSILLKPILWLSGIAASIAIVFGISYFNTNELDFSKLTNNEILAHIEANDSEFSTDEIKKQIDQKKGDSTKIEAHKNFRDAVVEKLTTQEKVIEVKSFNEILNSFSDEDLYLYLNSDEVEIEEMDIL